MANGVWLPVVLIFILLLVNRRDLMGEYVNSLSFNIVAWFTSIAMIVTYVVVCTRIFRPDRCRLSALRCIAVPVMRTEIRCAALQLPMLVCTRHFRRASNRVKATELLKSANKEETALLEKLDPTRFPQHLAIIMDGNGRWAQRRHLPRMAGHRAGVKAAREIIETSRAAKAARC